MNISTGTSFSGPNSVFNLLDPEVGLPLPLVELPEGLLNPFHKERVRIFAKILSLSPLLNIKLLAALNMLREADKKGELRGVHTIVENSSGNAALALAVLAPLYGIKHVVAIVPADTAPGKLEILRLSRVESRFSSEIPGQQSGIASAKKLGEQQGWFCPRQYENDANSQAYERWLGPQIFDQTRGKVTIFAAGIGTGGTITGTSRALKKLLPSTTIIGVTPDKDNVPGVRSLERLKEVTIDWRSAIDHHAEVNAYESYLRSLHLFRCGIYGGPSAGLALAGLFQFLKIKQSAGMLDHFRNADGDVVAVFPCPDSPLPYLEKYSTHLNSPDLA